MTDTLPPTDVSARAVTLGERLRMLRKAANVTGQQLASSARLSQPKISKIERGRVLPSPDDIARIGRALEVDPGELREIIGEATELAEFSRSWRAIHREGLVGAQREAQFTERLATDIIYFHSVVIPGLLQYRQYAREILVRANVTEQIDIDEAVNVRMERQDLLHSTDRQFHFIMLETALMCRYCPPEIMNIQLDLLGSVSKLPNVTMGIVSYDTILPVVPTTGFGLFDRSAVMVEMLHGEVVLSDEVSVSAYLDAVGQLEACAQYGDDALTLIDRVRRTLAPGGSLLPAG